MRVYQDFQGEVPTLKRADGKFENLLHGDAAFVMMGRQPIDLVLDDGRHAMIILKDLQGYFVVTGPIG